MPLISKRLVLVFAIPLFLVAARANAEGPISSERCAENAERAQRLRDESKLLDARELMVSCARRECPAAVRNECVVWLDQIAARIPTVVPSVRDEAGNDVADVRVSLDGSQIAAEITGSAVAMDPGRHTFRFERGATFVEVPFVAREGELRRIVVGTLPRSAPPPVAQAAQATRPSETPVAAAPPKSSLPTGVFIAGGMGIVALGVAAGMGISGALDYERMKDSCSPTCAHDDVTRARTKLGVATVAGLVGLGAGSVALGIALWSRPKTTAFVAPTLPVDGAPLGLSARVGF